MGKRKILLAAAIALGLLLYLLGIKLALVPILIGANTIALPMPTFLRSWLSRAVIAGLVTMSLLQLGGALQFLLFPSSGFRTLASITAVVSVALLAVAPSPTLPRPRSIVDTRDCCGVLVAFFFLLPFSPILIGRNSANRIAEIGGLQAIDGPNHYANIEGMTDEQHLDYAIKSYYPKGFPLATGFIQNTVFDKQIDLGWQGNALLYFFQYMVWGSLLAYLLFYLCLSWAVTLVRAGPRWVPLVAALCLGPSLALLYLIPWVYLGFLSYDYVALTIVASLLFLTELSRQRGGAGTPLFADADARWYILASLVMLYGAGMTWTLLLPPTVLSIVLFMLPANLHPVAFVKQMATVRALPVLITLVLLLIPIYFQLKYSATGASQGINSTGGLYGFHSLVLIAGTAILALLAMSSRVAASHKRLLTNIFLPQLAFLSLIVAEQYFAVGEVRYYAIKTALLVEMLLLALGVGALLFAYIEHGGIDLKYALMLPVVPAAIIVLLISTVADPLQGTRDLFRGHSGSTKPPFLDMDVREYVQLGLSGRLQQFNSTSLHYDRMKQKFYSHMEIPFWADMMQYAVTGGGYPALVCIRQVYQNLAFGSFTDQEQQALIVNIDQCASLARDHGRPFYVVTDSSSAPFVRRALGDLVEVVF